MTLNVNATYNGIKRNFLLRLRVFYFKVKIFHCALLANLSPNCQENYQNQHAITLAMNELLCLKNVGAQIAMAKMKVWHPWQLKKTKSWGCFGATS